MCVSVVLSFRKHSSIRGILCNKGRKIVLTNAVTLVLQITFNAVFYIFVRVVV